MMNPEPPLTLHGATLLGPHAWVVAVPRNDGTERYLADAGYARTRLGAWIAGRRSLARLRRSL